MQSKEREYLPLYRREAVEERFARLPGNLVIRFPRSLNIAISAFLMAVCAAASVLLLSEFSKKEIARGRLVPTLGLIKIIPGVGGTLAELRVKQGDHVASGQVLAVVASDTAQFGGKQAIEGQIASAKGSLRELTQQILREQQQADIKSSRLQSKAEGFSLQIDAREAERQLLVRNIETLRRAADAARGLAKAQALSVKEADKRANELRESELQLSALNRDTVNLKVELAQASADLKALPKELDVTISKLNLQQIEISQKISGLEAQLHYEVVSPREGTVDYVAFRPGQTITPSTSLLSIVPQESMLEGELFVPVRSITSLKPGQPLRIDYEPFPAARFGYAQGQIKTVNQTVLDPDELKALGFSSVVPVYRITARLDRQDFPVGGQPIQLRAGIGFGSDIIVERHPLWRWAYQFATEAWHAR